MEAKGESWAKADEEKFKDPIRARYEEEGSPYHATARLWDDGIIDPRDTRTVLGISLSAAHSQAVQGTTQINPASMTACVTACSVMIRSRAHIDRADTTIAADYDRGGQPTHAKTKRKPVA